jgi:acyl carrier protein
MGMDMVEIVLRTEEVFCVELPDQECGRVVTVGDLYRLVLSKIALEGQPVSAAEAAKSEGRSRLAEQFPALRPWTSPDVWATLVALIQDELQVDFDEITEDATFVDDLRCD